MKIYPDGSIEGSPEELAAYQHISAAMDKTDAARARRQATQSNSPSPRPKKTVAKRHTAKVISISEALEMARGLDHDGKGFSAKDLAAALDAPLKTAYNKLYSLRTRGDLVLKDGVFKFPKRDVDSESEVAQAI